MICLFVSFCGCMGYKDKQSSVILQFPRATLNDLLAYRHVELLAKTPKFVAP